MGKNAQLRKQRAKTAIHTTSTTTGESIHEHLKLLATIPITNPQIQTKLLDLVEQIPEHTKLAHALRKKQFRNAQNIISSNAGKITLGKLQRWIRECDDVKPVLAASDEQMGENEEMNAEEREDDEKWKTMEMIIRSANRNEKESTLTTKRTLIKQPPWVCPRTLRARQEMYKMVCERNICSEEEKHKYEAGFSILTTIEGLDRKPPNLHPAIIWHSIPNTIMLKSDNDVVKYDIPHLKNSFMLANVIGSETCREVVAAAETMGFTPDDAIGGSATTLTSVLAHNFYWMSDETFCTALFDRIKDFLPQEINGYQIRSINRRFRTYRYVPGALYRPHIDGAWPPSGIDGDGNYVYDASPPGNPQYSRFTFLLYLNDEFSGGETTFFVPNEHGAGLCSYPVTPSQGCVMIFPHGDTAGSQVHEGSGVVPRFEGEKCAKYIIRSDVVYDVPLTGRAAMNIDA